MQDSMELGSSQGQVQNHNQFPLSQVISPKGRRLTKGYNLNTASQQSLAYSNSTYTKNHFTERSPPMFNLDFLNNQNINTLNFRPFDRKQSTFGSHNGLAIEFDKIKEESYLSNEDQQKYSNAPYVKQKLQIPYFLSNENTPDKIFHKQNDSLDLQNQEQQTQQIQKRVVQNKKYVKINPSNKKQLKQKIVSSMLDKHLSDQPQSKSSKNLKDKKNKVQSKENYILIQHNQSRQKSPLQAKNKSPLQTKNQGPLQKKNRSLLQAKNRGPSQAKNKSPFERRSKSPNQNRNFDQVQTLRQKVKQLEYGLQVQSISTEELRTKVCVLNQLLQAKFLQKNGINFRLFKNSLPSIKQKNSLSQNRNQGQNMRTQTMKDQNNFSNIDLYVQMKVIQRAKQQIQIEHDRVRNQLHQKTKQLGIYVQKCEELGKRLITLQRTKQQTKTQTSFNCGLGTLRNQKSSQSLKKIPSEDAQIKQSRIIELQQERQTLLEYIEVQKRSLQTKDKKNDDLSAICKQYDQKAKQSQNYLQLLTQKQKRFAEIQRPRLLSQIKDLNDKLQTQKQQIQRLEMQNNLRQMKIDQGALSDNYKSAKSSAEKQVSALQLRTQRSKRNFCLFRQKSLVSMHDSAQKSLVCRQDSAQKLVQMKQNAIPDAMSVIMLQQEQLKIVKSQREYFREQYESIRQFQRQNYNLRLKNQDLQNELNSLHQLIEMEEEITF